jgi:uncharacterized membrane protein (DUF4010 family)
MDTEIFERLALALAIGLLIGVERGWQEREGVEGSRTAGIRTFTLIALAGGINAALIEHAGPLPLALSGGALAIVFGAFQWRENKTEGSFSITSFIAALLTYGLGALAVLGPVAPVAAAGVAAAALLAARQPLHNFLRRLTWKELRSAILLLAMTFILLPILPREPVDPWGVLIPYELWLIVILIATLSFAGYVAVRVMGERRGLALAAAAGALVSSTAVTLNNSRLAATRPEARRALSGAICIAWGVSLIRMTIVACAINRALILPLGIPAFMAAGVMFLSAVVFYRSAKIAADSDGLKLSNPFELPTVLLFGVALAIVLPASKFVSEILGAAGLFVFAAASGAVDVDPIVLSAARLAGDSVTNSDAAIAILIAGAANILAKAVVAISVGGAQFGKRLAISGSLSFVVGLTIIMVVRIAGI